VDGRILGGVLVTLFVIMDPLSSVPILLGRRDRACNGSATAKPTWTALERRSHAPTLLRWLE
jgi:hypothetical protein